MQEIHIFKIVKINKYQNVNHKLMENQILQLHLLTINLFSLKTIKIVYFKRCFAANSV